MPSNHHKVEQLIAKFHHAFQHLDVPADGMICSSSRERIAAEPGLQRLISHLSAQYWMKVDAMLMREHAQDLPLLTPEAFRYFVPAFATYALRCFPEEDDVLSFLLMSLDPTDRHGIKLAILAERFRLFDADQRAAVKRFLIFFRSESRDATTRKASTDALESYWQG